ncbi:hypothetical protein EYF80_055800 [Liparis tanakae]|uniref:Uncharacterized protein n=1 Tax=Liparis tanakae TaxID=230148 RepID=A0A4Z2EYI0_9TELE|nr:hypothetical protein EYF80_055800 [Liparis tanakae]
MRETPRDIVLRSPCCRSSPVAFPLLNVMLAFPLLNVMLAFPLLNVMLAFPLLNVMLAFPLLNVMLAFPLFQRHVDSVNVLSPQDGQSGT